MRLCCNQIVTAECDGQVLLGLSLSWLLCYVLTVTDVLPTDPTAYGHLARTDTRGDVLSQAPWFRLPYPGTATKLHNPFPYPLLLYPAHLTATTGKQSAKNQANTHKHPAVLPFQ